MNAEANEPSVNLHDADGQPRGRLLGPKDRTIYNAARTAVRTAIIAGAVHHDRIFVALVFRRRRNTAYHMVPLPSLLLVRDSVFVHLLEKRLYRRTVMFVHSSSFHGDIP